MQRVPLSERSRVYYVKFGEINRNFNVLLGLFCIGSVRSVSNPQPCCPSRSAFQGEIMTFEAESMRLIHVVFQEYCSGTNFGAID